jgi:hypothetical protein
MKIQAICSIALIAVTIAGPVLAATGDVCLRHDRIWSWRALDDRTISVTDISHKNYIVNLRWACTGLTYPNAVLIFHTLSDLDCISDDNIVGVTSPGIGFVNCSIASVQAGAPAAPPHG